MRNLVAIKIELQTEWPPEKVRSAIQAMFMNRRLPDDWSHISVTVEHPRSCFEPAKRRIFLSGH